MEIIAPKYRKLITVFFWCEVGSLMDYLLRYSETLFEVYGHEITFGTIKLFIIGITSLIFIWKAQ